MEIYVGYGFNVNEIQKKDWLALMRTHDPREYEAFLEDTKENFEEELAEGGNLESILENEVEERICENAMGRAEYLRDIINEGESESAGTDNIVCTYDNYLVFDSIRFLDDEPRAKYITSQGSFISMIGRYIPVADLTFGNLFEGSDWADPSYDLN